jgi:hypothetical protein
MRPFPLRGGTPDRRAERRESLPPAEGAAPPRWDDVDGVATLVQQIVDAVQNWRDSAQAGLPGYRDRVCVLRLGEGEGGLHLDMDAATLRQLVQDGRDAGRLLTERFTRDGVQEHFDLRYRTLRGVLRRDLRPLDDPFGDLRMMLARWTRRNGHRPAGSAAPEDDAADMRIVPRL